jgi:hypothetical protein
MERPGRTIRVDPVDPPGEDDIVVLTAATPARSGGAEAALRAGRRLTLAGPDALVEAFAKLGRVDRVAPGSTVDGVRIELLPYTAAPIPRPLTHFLRASVAGARPAAALRRIAAASKLPACDPVIAQFTFPDGARFLHLDCALHAGTAESWLADAATRFGNAEWTLAGVPFGEGAAVCQKLPRFGPNRVLLAELVNAERRDLGLPTELVTPWRDRLVAQSIECHVFATQTSVRFE